MVPRLGRKKGREERSRLTHYTSHRILSFAVYVLARLLAPPLDHPSLSYRVTGDRLRPERSRNQGRDETRPASSRPFARIVAKRGCGATQRGDGPAGCVPRPSRRLSLPTPVGEKRHQARTPNHPSRALKPPRTMLEGENAPSASLQPSSYRLVRPAHTTQPLLMLPLLARCRWLRTSSCFAVSRLLCPRLPGTA